MKNKLWRFGDSYSTTQDDRFGDIELNHSVYISEHFDLELVHLGQGGLSNLEIFNKLLSNNQNYQKNDMILINFASFSRVSLVEGDRIVSTASDSSMTYHNKNIKNIIINDLQHSISDMIFYLVKPFLESLIDRGINVYHFYNDYDEKYINIKNELIFKNSITGGFTAWIHENGLEDLEPTGNVHYLVGKQREIAKEIIKKIEENTVNEK